MDGAPRQRKQQVPLIGVASALSVLIGVLAVHALPALPPRSLDALLALAGLLAVLRPRTRLLGCALLGFAWCALRADLAFDARLPRELEGRDFEVIGVVDDLPLPRRDALRFVLRIESARLDGNAVPLRGHVRLSWYGAAPAHFDACDRWQLRLRLKRPRGLLNLGGTDSERQALERGIVAVGYVREADTNQRLGEQHLCVDRLRAEISTGIAARIADPHDAALMRALAVGDTRGLDRNDWDTARATGVSHLLSISGFHVGVAALSGAALMRLLWWLWPALGLRLALPLAQAPAALATAMLYGLLAGASLPTVRTLVMIAVVVLARLGRRGGDGLQSLSIAALAVLVFDPLATLSAGFWLSFVGVALLMLYLARARGVRGFLRELGIGQLVMTVALLPLGVWFFGQASLVGALANLVAVPLVSFVIVPLGLAAILALLLAPLLATPLLFAAGWLVHALWWLLQHMAGWPGAHWYLPDAAPWAPLLAMAGALWMLLPRGVPLRALGALLFLPLLWPDRPAPVPGAFEATVIDVGQGLSVFVRTRGHALLFDAGARYPSEFDLGEAAVLPTLRALGIRRLDVLMISHGDNDHAGGAGAVAAAYPLARRHAGEPLRMALPAAQCRRGQRWIWDGVAFSVLHPSPQAIDDRSMAPDNDRSCVLLVEGRAGRLLLSGDISRRVEAEIAAQVEPGPPLVLVVPHHGSNTSSSADFLRALRPQLALVSAGWRSRFGHPHPQVVARYAAARIPLRNTADAGALRVVFAPDAPPQLAPGERQRQQRHWRE